MESRKLLAKSNGQSLKEHSVRVANLAVRMAEYIGLSDDLIQCVYYSGLLHDIGKCTVDFQDFLTELSYGIVDIKERDMTFPDHHEISWAFCATKIGSSKILNPIYWHHARPILPNKTFYETHDDILSHLSDSDIELMEWFWKQITVGLNIPTINPPEESVKAPSLYNKTQTGNRLISLNSDFNSLQLILRTCLISADRYVSSHDSDEYAIENIISSDIYGEMKCPEEYDKKRFKIQTDCVKEAQKSKTTIVKAPAGFGKTAIGLNWILQRKKKSVWVCPRNSVAEAVFNNIKKELNVFNLNFGVELFLTSHRIDSINIEEDSEDFSSDIVITNIDNLLAPMANNRIAHRLFTVIGSDIIFDEFHELVSKQPLFSAFITFMRARHQLTNTNTLLLSATPMNINELWDDENKTAQLPNKDNHYPAAHNGKYQIGFSNDTGDCIDGKLTKHTSVRNTQYEYVKGYDNILHSKFNDIDRREKQNRILDVFGKNGSGIKDGENLAGSMVIQAAMDISFSHLSTSIHSPESDIQTCGRIDRWGNLQDQNPTINFVELDLRENPSERMAINCTYNMRLRNLWIEHLKNTFEDGQSIIQNDLYNAYNDFYKKYGKEVYDFVKSCYVNGLNGRDGLVSYIPTKKKEKEGYTRTLHSKSLRSPGYSYNFSLQKKGSKEWLGPDEIGGLNDGYELKRKYVNEGWRIDSKLCMKLLSNAGFEEIKSMFDKNKFPKNNEQWFRLSVDPDTPLPDISRVYCSEIGIIEKKDLDFLN